MDLQFIFNWFMNGFINFANGVIDVITTILPTSPFDAYLVAFNDSSLNSVLWIINYFVPIGGFVSITIAYANVLLLLQGESLIARWVKILEG